VIFYSPQFILFFIAFVVGLRFFPQGPLRMWYVVAASYVFYAGWYPPYLVVLIGLSALGYWGGLLVERHPRLSAPVIVALFLPLVVFKYSGFLTENAERLFGVEIAFSPRWQLPLGISFITFTVISYVIDIRRGVLKARTKFHQVALFAAYFPHLVAGPILRGRELLPQLDRIRFTGGMVAFGSLLFAVGAAKKVVLADGLGPWIDALYASDIPLTAGQSLLAIYGFTAQIYLDFSGYTDMAIGLAAIIGVRLPRNFERPYLSASVRDFWRRWHMTLSRWLRDYIYIPFGGNRHGFTRMMMAIMATMLLGGLWHGAAWTFVIWGGAHGAAMVFEHVSGRIVSEPVLPIAVRRLIVLNFVAATWVLFRASDFDQVGMVFSGLGNTTDWAAFGSDAAWPLLLLAIAAATHRFDSLSRVRWLSRRLSAPVTITIAVVAVALATALAVGNPGTFIYFDF